MQQFHLRTLFAVLFLLVTPLFLVSPVSAAKKRIFRPKTVSRQATGVTYSQARLSRPTHSIVVTFLNLGNVKRIDYVLTYAANGIEQGVVGAFVPSGQATDSRDFYFGTCSKGVCTPHYNITNATLTVSTTLLSRGVHIKRYRIKI